MKCILVLLACLCASEASRSRIVNGDNASNGEFPYQGSLEWDGSHTCGCVLISTTWSLTAAHCTDGRQTPSRYQTWYGVTNRGGSAGTKYNVAAIEQHNSYSSGGGFPNDICALRSSSTISGSNIGTIAPYGGSNTTPSGCVLSGWGQTCTGVGCATPPNALQKCTINGISAAACRGFGPPFNTVSDSFHQCFHNGNCGACMGDSGGPGRCSSGGHRLFGLTSWGLSSCDVNFPSVYVRVSQYCSWISQHTGVGCSN